MLQFGAVIVFVLPDLGEFLTDTFPELDSTTHLRTTATPSLGP